RYLNCEWLSTLSASPVRQTRLSRVRYSARKIPIKRHLSLLPFHEKRSHNQNVHVIPKKTGCRLFWGADNRLVFIDSGIQQHRNSRKLPDLLYQLPIEGSDCLVNALQPSSSINMSYCRYGRSFLRLHFIGHYHEWRGVGLLEVLADRLGKNRGRER